MKTLNSILAKSVEWDYHSLATELFKQTEAAKDNGNEESDALLGAYATACHMVLDPDDKAKPFKPLFTNYQEGTRTLDAGDLTDAQLDIFSSTWNQIALPLLRCRICDILWTRKRDFKAAGAAIEAYLAYFADCVSRKELHDCLPAIERAIRLSYHTGQKETYLPRIVSILESNVLPIPDALEYFFISKVLNLLFPLETGKLDELCAASRNVATIAKNKGEWHWEQEFLEIEARWHRRAKRREKETEALMLAAETLERRGDSCITSTHKDYMSASNWYSQAIEEFRKIPGGKARADDIHSKLLKIQPQVPGMLSMIESPKIDLSEGIAGTQAAVSGKSFFDALYALAFLIAPPNYDKEREEARKTMKQFPLQSIVSKQILSSDGRVTARVPSAFSDSVGDQDLCLWDKTIERAKYLHFLHVAGVIRPGITQICREHPFRYEDFFPVVVNNPFVPRGREILFAKGFAYGLMLDWIESAHLLIPQLENSIRYVLGQHGFDTSTFDTDGIQDSDSLNKSLEVNELRDILGADHVQDLKVLLIDRYGYNLRNEMAHGLLSGGAFNYQSVPYLWWLTLRLCMIPHANARHAERKENGKQRIGSRNRKNQNRKKGGKV